MRFSGSGLGHVVKKLPRRLLAAFAPRLVVHGHARLAWFTRAHFFLPFFLIADAPASKHLDSILRFRLEGTNKFGISPQDFIVSKTTEFG